MSFHISQGLFSLFTESLFAGHGGGYGICSNKNGGIKRWPVNSSIKTSSMQGKKLNTYIYLRFHVTFLLLFKKFFLLYFDFHVYLVQNL